MSYEALFGGITNNFATQFWMDYPSIPVQFGDWPLYDSSWAIVPKPSPEVDDPLGTAWIRLTFQPVTRRPETFTEDRTTLRVVFDVFTAYGAGAGYAATLVDSVLSYLPRQTTNGVAYITADGELPSALPGFRTDDGFLQTPVTAPAIYWGGATADPLEFSQTAHGFSVGDWIGVSGGVYAKALAGTIDPIGVVTAVPTANAFRMVGGGLARLASHGFALGASIYLSTSSAGDATATPTTTPGESKRLVAWAVHADYVNVEIMPEEVL